MRIIIIVSMLLSLQSAFAYDCTIKFVGPLHTISSAADIPLLIIPDELFKESLQTNTFSECISRAQSHIVELGAITSAEKPVLHLGYVPRLLRLDAIKARFKYSENRFLEATINTSK